MMRLRVPRPYLDHNELLLDKSVIINEGDEDLSDEDNNSRHGDCVSVAYGCRPLPPNEGGGGGGGNGGYPFYTFRRHSGELYAVACSPTDATLVATGGGDGEGFLWKIGQRDWERRLDHKDSVIDLAFSYDGQFLASGSMDGMVQVWDEFGDLKWALKGPREGIAWLRWHPKEHILSAGSDDSTVWMWDADSGAVLNTFAGHDGMLTCGDFTPDGKIICTGSTDATLRIWNTESGENIHVVQGHAYHTEGLRCLAISPSSTLALTGSEDGSTHIVNITTGRVINTLASRSGWIECVGFAPSGSLAAIGSLDQKLEIWDIEHSLCRGTFDHQAGLTCLAWVDASYVATGCLDGIVRLWDTRSSECVQIFKGHTEEIASLSVSANREFLVSASYDHTACCFDIRSFE